MIIYRIEDKNGEGPYHGDIDSSLWRKEKHCYETGRPIPSKDGVNGFDFYKTFNADKHLFGFSSMKQLKEWFCDEEIEKLYEFGYNIYEFEIDSIDLELDHQIVFDKNKCKLKGVI